MTNLNKKKMEDYKKILQIEVHNIVDRLQNGLIHPYTAKQEIFNSTLKAINYTHSCKSDSEQFPSFLYKHEGGLYFKHLEDTDITEQWNEYLKTR